MKRFPWVMLALLIVATFILQALHEPLVHAIPGETVYDGINTGLSGDDGGTNSPVPLGFTFNFYQQNYTSSYVNINGTLNFANAFGEYTNYELPFDPNTTESGNPGPSVMAFWDDIITYNFERESILYKTVGSPGSRKFIMQWTNMYFYSNPSLPLGTFQVILYEGSNKVQLQYRDLLGGGAALGSSATIGISKDASTAEPYSFNTESLTQGQAISYTPGDGDAYDVNSNATYDPVYLSEAGAPGIPVLLTPNDAATSTSRTPDFTWQAAEDATSYRFLISTDSGFSNIVMNRTGLTGTEFHDISFLDANTTYYWKIEAINPVTSAFSTTRSFTTGASTGTEPAAPTLVSPTNGAGSLSTKPTFTWSAANLATSYRVYVSTESDFSSMTLDQAGITGTSWTPTTPLAKSENYYWRVEAYNTHDSTFSGTRSFSTAGNRQPDDPTDLSPDTLLGGHEITANILNGTPLTMTLTDPDEDDQVKYRIRIATDPGFSGVVIDYTSPLQSQGAASYAFGHTTGGTYNTGNINTMLTSGQDYYVRITDLDQSNSQGGWAGPTPSAFTLIDHLPDDDDGAAETAEDQAPNGGDANNDGTPDKLQATVTSFMDPVSGKYAALETTGCTSNSHVNTASEDLNAIKDGAFNYPAGLMNFTINCSSNGATATVTQYFYGVNPTDMVLRKYNPTTSAYATIEDAVISSVIIGGQQAAKVVYQITDGGPLDQDGTANGTIVDPSGLAQVASAATTADPGAPDTGLQSASIPYPALSLVVGAAGVMVGGRRTNKAAKRRAEA
jgi:hypothetical protein